VDVNVVVVELVVVDVDVVEVKLVVVDVVEVELVVVALVVVPGRRTIVVESVLIWHLVPCHFFLQWQAPVVSLQPTLPRARH